MALTSANATLNPLTLLHSNKRPIPHHHGPAAAAPATSVVADTAPEAARHVRGSSLNLPTSLLTNLLNFQVQKTSSETSDNFCRIISDRRTPSRSPSEDITSLHDEIHGHASWAHLLNPLHPWLRREIIKYGEFSQATYDAFDYNPFSEFCGSCLYGHQRLFEQLGLGQHGYDVTKYLYAMSHVELPQWLERSVHADVWSKDSNWIGFVAVSGDAESRRIGCRDIVVAWRGTVKPAEWYEDVQGKLEPLLGHGVDGDDDVKVEHGFQSIYKSKDDKTRYNKSSASEQVMSEIKRLVDHYKSKGEEVSLTITGHSLGGALALLNASEAASKLKADVAIKVINFGGPRVGNSAFADRLDELKVKVMRLVVKQDLVPKVPGILFNENIEERVEKIGGKFDWVYTHVGIEVGLDVRSSPYLKRGIDVAGFHNLEAYLHLVDGYMSSSDKFRGSAKRDVALVNKSSGLLRDELKIPAFWSQMANKGLVCNKNGRWVQPKREFEDIPSPYRTAMDHVNEL